jgi:hypothetical protein
MPQSLNLTIKGLHTSNSDISGVPPGSLSIANNLDLTKLNLAQCRRGFGQLGTGLPSAGYRATRLFDYSGYIFAIYNSTLNYYSSGWVTNGALIKPANALVSRFTNLSQNLYITSSTGVKKIDSATGTLYSAGIPNALDMALTADLTVVGTAVSNNKKVAYRHFIGRYDANNNFVRGGVSGRVTYDNAGSGNTRNVVVKGFIPTTIDNTYIAQIYRSDEFATGSTGVIDDELQLCYEIPIDSNMFSTAIKTISSVDTVAETLTSNSHGYKNGTIVQIAASTTLPAPFVALTDYFVIGVTTNTFQLASTFGGTAINITTTGSGTITTRGVNAFCFYDITPNALLGSTIYTAPSQQGLINNNAPPPLCSDLANFKNFLFYADTESLHRFSFTLISVKSGASGVLDIGNTITIGSEVYTAAAAENVASKNFKLTSGVSTASDIDATIKSFISVVNQGSSLYYAYSATVSDDDLPGKVRIEARTLGASSFSVVSSNQAAFNPQLTSAATTNQTSKSDAFRNGLMFSKQSEGEAVPIKNQLRVGNSDDPISRIVTIRDSLLIFKAKDGTYILRGDNETNFSVQLLDATAKLVAPESIAILNSQVYGLFEAGICSVSDTSVEVVSDAIKNKLQALYGQALVQIKAYSFGVGYETEGNYILSVPETSGATYATKQYVYNVFNRNFWEWNLSVGSGLVSSSDGKLYFGSAADNRILKEFKDFTQDDFRDYEASLTLSSYVTTTLTISGTAAMTAGDLLVQTGLDPSYIVSVNSAAGTCVVDLSQSWNTGLPVLHYKAIACTMEWNPDFAGNPAGLKHYQTLNMLFNSALIKTGTLTFSGDTNPGVNQITITGPTSSGGFGYMAWDDGPWGGDSAPLPIRVGVPRLNARANNLTVKFEHRIAGSDWKLGGVALDFLPTSTRTAR